MLVKHFCLASGYFFASLVTLLCFSGSCAVALFVSSCGEKSIQIGSTHSSIPQQSICNSMLSLVPEHFSSAKQLHKVVDQASRLHSESFQS